jgi:hypothetical protein
VSWGGEFGCGLRGFGRRREGWGRIPGVCVSGLRGNVSRDGRGVILGIEDVLIIVGGIDCC